MHLVIYTLGRKFPRLIGKFPNGKPIPFGPFTYVQAGVLVGGVAALAMIVQIFDPPKIPTLVLGAAVIVPAAAAARRIGFSMARTSSRLIWVTRPWLQRSPISTAAGRPTRAQRRLTHTGSDRKIYEAD